MAKCDAKRRRDVLRPGGVFLPIAIDTRANCHECRKVRCMSLIVRSFSVAPEEILTQPLASFHTTTWLPVAVTLWVRPGCFGLRFRRFTLCSRPGQHHGLVPNSCLATVYQQVKRISRQLKYLAVKHTLSLGRVNESSSIAGVIRTSKYQLWKLHLTLTLSSLSNADHVSKPTSNSALAFPPIRPTHS